MIRQWLAKIRISWLWVCAAVFLSVIVHICAVLIVPYIAERDAWARLSAISSVNQMYILPAGDTEPPLPLMASNVNYAFCRFDLSEKNVALRPNLPDTTSMLAIYTRYGENFYFITGAEARGKDLRLLLVPRERLARETVTEKTEEGDDQIIVITPTTTGIIVIHAPVRSGAFMEASAEALQEASCELQKATDTELLAQGVDTPAAAPAPPPAAEKRQRRGTRNYR